ncbi:MAG: ROK family protein [Candidatus Tectomicrobia bacterium]|nr:ROK family protein [Candidatus Tectomicrobia bacterium]
MRGGTTLAEEKDVAKEKATVEEKAAVEEKVVVEEKVALKAGPKTLAIDIGGTGIKMMVLDESGVPTTDRARSETPRPAKPKPIVDLIAELAKTLGEYDRISVGFPGVVHDGVVYTAANLDPEWVKFDLQKTLEEQLGKPARVINDADVQGYGAIEGHGLELVLTLGTGLGSALFIDGRLVPNLELAHHPFRKGKTYEQMVGRVALEKIGKKRWNKRVIRMIEQLEKAINYRTLYLGGGNAKKLNIQLPSNVHTVSNEAGLLGGIALWRY